MGQCPACREWNTFAEEPAAAAPGRKATGAALSRKEAPHPQYLREISLDPSVRLDTGLEELNRVLGGGIMQGSLVLVGGDPGIGKSTLLLQVCRNLALAERRFSIFRGRNLFSRLSLELTGWENLQIPCFFCVKQI